MPPTPSLSPEERIKQEKEMRALQAKQRAEKEAAARAAQEEAARKEQQQIAESADIRSRYATRVDLIRAHGTPEEMKQAYDALAPTAKQINERL